ncbi:hypothetical protein [Pseudochrobactrum sp. MP213Fo]|uniref:hypothetical protein n=1 Tax=Pseudochrobactrum sp. MP213Fo TaxID=3022250 RepID=UPI003BA356DD
MLTDQTLSKGEFAKLINVSAGRISQYIASGQIGPDALQGEGRSARIVVDRARRQLNGRLDVAQRVGLNGLSTRIAMGPVEQADNAPLLQQPDKRPLETFQTQSDLVADQIAREKLEQAKMATARIKREEALASGRFILADEARSELTRGVAMAYRVMEGGLSDMATHLAGRFELPQRDILHHLQQAFRKVRERAAQGFAEQQAMVPQVLDDPDLLDEGDHQSD